MNSDDPYKPFIFEEVEFNEDDSASQLGMRQLDAQAAKFCKDGERWIQSREINENDQTRCLNAIQDWLLLRRASRESVHILELNKVGGSSGSEEKTSRRDNMASIIE